MKTNFKVWIEIAVVLCVIAALAVIDWLSRWVPGDRPGYYEE